jgi:SpoIID/LytB domain protein
VQLPEDPPIRVLLTATTSPLCFTPQGQWRIENSKGRRIAVMPEGVATTITLENGKIHLGSAGAFTGADTDDAGRTSLDINAKSIALVASATSDTIALAASWSNSKRASHIYERRLDLHASRDNILALVTTLPIEEYLRGVVPSEIGASSPLQAQCAQAVAARSFAVLALLRRSYSGADYDICSTVQCQVYGGISKATASSDEAITSTRGKILAFHGEPMAAYYSGMCGGFCEDIKNVWPGRGQQQAYAGIRFDGDSTNSLNLSNDEAFADWLNSNPAAYCNPKKFDVPKWTVGNFNWTREIPVKQLSRDLESRPENKRIGQVKAIRVLKRSASGRIIELEFVGTNGTIRVSRETEVRQAFHPMLKSASFLVETKGPSNHPTEFVLHGRGSGHGVGMCQTGAMGMANAGKDFHEILRHYYPHAEIKKLY